MGKSVFTLEDMRKCFWLGINSRPVVGPNMTAKEINAEPNQKFEDFIQSLKQHDERTTLQLMHDTMSPVNTIKGSIALLKKGDLTPADRNKLLDAIEDRANKLNEVLDAYYVSLKGPVVFNLEFTPADNDQAIARSKRGKHLIYIKTESGNREWIADVYIVGSVIPFTTVQADAKVYEGWSEAAKDAIRLKKSHPKREFHLEEL